MGWVGVLEARWIDGGGETEEAEAEAALWTRLVAGGSMAGKAAVEVVVLLRRKRRDSGGAESHCRVDLTCIFGDRYPA